MNTTRTFSRFGSLGLRVCGIALGAFLVLASGGCDDTGSPSSGGSSSGGSSSGNPDPQGINCDFLEFNCALKVAIANEHGLTCGYKKWHDSLTDAQKAAVDQAFQAANAPMPGKTLADRVAIFDSTLQALNNSGAGVTFTCPSSSAPPAPVAVAPTPPPAPVASTPPEPPAAVAEANEPASPGMAGILNLGSEAVAGE